MSNITSQAAVAMPEITLDLAPQPEALRQAKKDFSHKNWAVFQSVSVLCPESGSQPGTITSFPLLRGPQTQDLLAITAR